MNINDILQKYRPIFWQYWLRPNQRRWAITLKSISVSDTRAQRRNRRHKQQVDLIRNALHCCCFLFSSLVTVLLTVVRLLCLPTRLISRRNEILREENQRAYSAIRDLLLLAYEPGRLCAHHIRRADEAQEQINQIKERKKAIQKQIDALLSPSTFTQLSPKPQAPKFIQIAALQIADLTAQDERLSKAVDTLQDQVNETRKEADEWHSKSGKGQERRQSNKAWNEASDKRLESFRTWRRRHRSLPFRLLNCAARLLWMISRPFVLLAVGAYRITCRLRIIEEHYNFRPLLLISAVGHPVTTTFLVAVMVWKMTWVWSENISGWLIALVLIVYLPFAAWGWIFPFLTSVLRMLMDRRRWFFLVWVLGFFMVFAWKRMEPGLGHEGLTTKQTWSHPCDIVWSNDESLVFAVHDQELPQLMTLSLADAALIKPLPLDLPQPLTVPEGEAKPFTIPQLPDSRIVGATQSVNRQYVAAVYLDGLDYGLAVWDNRQSIRKCEKNLRIPLFVDSTHRSRVQIDDVAWLYCADSDKKVVNDPANPRPEDDRFVAVFYSYDKSDYEHTGNRGTDLQPVPDNSPPRTGPEYERHGVVCARIQFLDVSTAANPPDSPIGSAAQANISKKQDTDAGIKIDVYRATSIAELATIDGSDGPGSGQSSSQPASKQVPTTSSKGTSLVYDMDLRWDGHGSTNPVDHVRHLIGMSNRPSAQYPVTHSLYQVFIDTEASWNRRSGSRQDGRQRVNYCKAPSLLTFQNDTKSDPEDKKAVPVPPTGLDKKANKSMAKTTTAAQVAVSQKSGLCLVAVRQELPVSCEMAGDTTPPTYLPSDCKAKGARELQKGHPHVHIRFQPRQPVWSGDGQRVYFIAPAYYDSQEWVNMSNPDPKSFEKMAKQFLAPPGYCPPALTSRDDDDIDNIWREDDLWHSVRPWHRGHLATDIYSYASSYQDLYNVPLLPPSLVETNFSSGAQQASQQTAPQPSSRQTLSPEPIFSDGSASPAAVLIEPPRVPDNPIDKEYHPLDCLLYVTDMNSPDGTLKRNIWLRTTTSGTPPDNAISRFRYARATDQYARKVNSLAAFLDWYHDILHRTTVKENTQQPKEQKADQESIPIDVELTYNHDFEGRIHASAVGDRLYIGAVEKEASNGITRYRIRVITVDTASLYRDALSEIGLAAPPSDP